MEVQLEQLLSSIDTPATDGSVTSKYQVIEIPGFNQHYVGKDINGAPCLLISSTDSGVKPPLRLAGIEAYFALQCSIATTEEQERIETLTVITCTASDTSLQTYFCYIAEVILEIIGASPSLQQVADAVWRLVELFQKLASPPSKSVMGLWGELYAIYQSQDPGFAVETWRGGVDDRFDFSVENLRIEVKTTGSRVRAHEFSFEQCNLSQNFTGILISLMTEPNGGGTALYELIERISAQLGNRTELVLKLQNIVADTLGESLAQALDMRFDEQLARESLQLFDLKQIPAIRAPVPEETSSIRFRTDLSSINSVPRESFSLNSRVCELLPEYT